MERISDFLNQPFPVTKKAWKDGLIAAIIVFIIVCLSFQPFGGNGLFNKKSLFYTLSISIIVFVSCSITDYILPLLFRKFYNPDNWTKGKYFINQLIILFIGAVGCTIFDYIIMHRTLEIMPLIFILYLAITLIIGIIPVAITFLRIQNNALKQHLKEAKELNIQLVTQSKTSQIEASTPKEYITLSGNTKDSIDLCPEDILYIETSGNYTKINYISQSGTQQRAIRSTLSQIEAVLAPYPYIMKCHRAFLVNTHKITNFEGNSNGYQLTLIDPKLEVPVSRKYTKDIREQIKASL